ncbi:MAG TPA: hypothetical protein VJ803_07435 [Gemmatimonadaceae bacterium]|nr:hypothetical protein [Gemmatimonadaceae bacterium]
MPADASERSLPPPDGPLRSALLKAVQAGDPSSPELRQALREFATSARQQGTSPEQLVIILKRCLSLSEARERRLQEALHDRALDTALDAYYSGRDLRGVTSLTSEREGPRL